MDRCQWKLVEPMSFTFGVKADRCGEVADVKIVRPQRKKDLFLCEKHVNAFINEWGLRQNIEILCRCEDDWNKANGIDWDDIEPAPVYPLEWSDICRHGRPECECGGAK